MSIPIKNLRDETDRLMEILGRNSTKLKSYDGVQTIGIGLRERNGELDYSESCIYVEVTEKKPESSLSQDQILPKTLEGVGIDVITIGKVEELILEIDESEAVDRTSYRPVRSGAQVTNNLRDPLKPTIFSVGTLGVVGHSKAKSSDPLGILSNKHVLYAKGGKDGTKIYQSTAKVGGEIGENITSFQEYIPGTEPPRKQIDVGLAKINVEGNNGVISTKYTINGHANPYLKETVYKYGRTTRFTHGQIVRLGEYISKTTFHTEIVILGKHDPPFIGFENFSESGDSGSAVFNVLGNVVAILWGGHEYKDGFKFTFANSIGYVYSKVEKKITFPLPAKLNSPVIGNDKDRLKLYYKILMNTSKGRNFVEAFIDSYPEGQSLIHHNRACMVTWIRNAGPEFIQLRQIEFASEPYFLKKEINGIKISHLFTEMKKVFLIHGSEKLKASITKHYDDIVDAFVEAESLEDVIGNLSK